MSRPRRLASVVLAAGLAAASGMAFEQTFRWQDLVPVVAAAAAIPLVICLLLFASSPSPQPSPSGEGIGRRPSRGEGVSPLGRPLWWSLVIGVAAWLVVVTVTVFRSPPTPGTIGVVVSSLGSSWKAILTVLPPVPARPQLLVLVHALVWASTLAGVEIALRTRAALAPALPALVVFAIALPFGAGGPGSAVAVGVVFAGLAGAMALLRG
ncbi:MAG: hypothetical protein J2P45_25300, partial [Candidatus Dormibacteraeota bacterium]|nr:hypothetical protein [Candidatus Dormibacteraeota bacterium]